MSIRWSTVKTKTRPGQRLHDAIANKTGGYEFVLAIDLPDVADAAVERRLLRTGLLSMSPDIKVAYWKARSRK